MALGSECDGKEAQAGDELTMEYTGSIDDSSPSGEPKKVFDTSIGRSPFTFNLGKGEVISCWDDGLVGVCPGVKGKVLICPSDTAYGDSGQGPDIPGGGKNSFSE